MHFEGERKRNFQIFNFNFQIFNYCLILRSCVLRKNTYSHDLKGEIAARKKNPNHPQPRRTKRKAYQGTQTAVIR